MGELLQERKKLQEDEGSQVRQACKGSPSTMLVIPLLTLLSQLSGYAVQAEKDEKKNCSELGFNTPNLMCSDCETLGRFQRVLHCRREEVRRIYQVPQSNLRGVRVTTGGVPAGAGFHQVRPPCQVPRSHHQVRSRCRPHH